MLVAPLLPGGGATSLRWARDADALLIGPGPYSGSYIVKGSLGLLALPALSHGALLISARFSGCGATTSGATSVPRNKPDQAGGAAF